MWKRLQKQERKNEEKKISREQINRTKWLFNSRLFIAEKQAAEYVAITSQNILQAKQPGQLLRHPKHPGMLQPGFLQQQATGAREKGDAEPSRRWPHGGPQLPTLN